jgi:cell wall-associated NlpC family hydrolase
MRKKLIKTLACGLVLSCLMSVSALAATTGGGTVSATALNLRADASLDSAIVGLIPGGAVVLVEEQKGEWTRVVYDGTAGYVSSEYVSFAEALDFDGGSAAITGENVRMRNGASTDAGVIGSFSSGDSFTVLGVSGEWLKVSTAGGSIGYVHSNYLDYGSAVKAGTSSSVPAAAAPAAYQSGAGIGSQLVETAKLYLGTPYVWAGMSPSGFDCSGFVNYVYKQYGYSMNRVAQDIYSNDGSYVDKDSLAVGDLVFFGYSGTNVTHVGMYIGDGQFIHASSGKGQVVITKLSENYYTRMYVGAKRIA